MFPFLQTNITFQMWLSGGNGRVYSVDQFHYIHHQHHIFAQNKTLYKLQ